MSHPKIVTDIIASYKKFNRKPIRGKWFGKHREISPLGAWAIYHGVKVNRKFIDVIVNSLLGESYVNGFHDEWEGREESFGLEFWYENFMDPTLYKRGRKHAKQVENLLRKEGILNERSKNR